MGTKQLTEKQRIRIRVLFFDGKYSKAQIQQMTGFSFDQIKRAVDAQVPKPRSSRPLFITFAEQ